MNGIWLNGYFYEINYGHLYGYCWSCFCCQQHEQTCVTTSLLLNQNKIERKLYLVVQSYHRFYWYLDQSLMKYMSKKILIIFLSINEESVLVNIFILIVTFIKVAGESDSCGWIWKRRFKCSNRGKVIEWLRSDTKYKSLWWRRHRKRKLVGCGRCCATHIDSIDRGRIILKVDYWKKYINGMRNFCYWN